MPGGRERLLFAAATAVVLLHVLVDAFVALEPGASRLEHLGAAGVPVAVPATTIGLHSDTSNAVEIARAIREALIREGVALQSLRQ